MKKLIFIAPHLSTGGMPQYLYKKIEKICHDYEVFVIEYSNVTGGVLVVQRNRILNIVPNDHFFTLSEESEILDIIKRISPDIIHFEEIPEYFMSYNIASQIYVSDRKYNIFETSHDSSFDINSKKFFPDKFFLVSEYQIKNLESLGIPCVLAEYPIEYAERPDRKEALLSLGLDPEYRHVINVGLFTPRKNQAEIFEYARNLKDYKIKFHFIGNQADNFSFYWKPLMEDVPENCVIWGERNDVRRFFEAADLFLFTSRGFTKDKETSPLVIREAIGYRVPSLIYNLPVYLGMYDQYPNIKYLSTDGGNEEKILQMLDIQKKEDDTKKIVIIDVYATTEDKKELLKKCIASVRKLKYPIMLVSHCTIPEEIVKTVDYHIFDADNQFNDNGVVSFRREEGVTINQIITRSHKFPIIRSMRLSLAAAKKLGYDFFYFTEFDHEYSDNGIGEILNLEKKVIFGDYKMCLWRPPHAVFGDVVGEYFDTCFFFGYTDYFIEKFDSYFPKTLEEYNQKFAPRFPNCLEHFFYELFFEKKILILQNYVKSHFSDSNINISSYSDTEYKILVDRDRDDCYLAIVNNNFTHFEYEVYLNQKLENSFTVYKSFKIIPLYDDVNIKIKVYRNGFINETIILEFSSSKIHEYRNSGNVVFTTDEDRKKIRNKMNIKDIEIMNNNQLVKAEIVETLQNEIPFEIFFTPADNKITFRFTKNVSETYYASIKDIDSKACIYYFSLGPSVIGSEWWSMPLPKHVIDFEHNKRFGGFHIDLFNSQKKLIGNKEIRIKPIEIKKPIVEISDTEPIFMNYEEFFVDRVYDILPIENHKVVLDIGANVGLWTKYILSKEAEEVYCFEPNLKAIDHLKKTLINDHNTHIIDKAVYKERATLQFYIDDANSLVSSLIPESGKSPSYDVDAITLEDAINLTGHSTIDLVKIDIEGAEFDIIENLSQSTSDRIDSFLIEFHDFYFQNGMHKVEGLQKKLEDLGFTVYRLKDPLKVIYASKIRKNYWLNRGGIIESRNLFETSKTFSWRDYNSGKSDGYNHMFNELHFTFDNYTQGCNYERYGCKIEKGDVVVDIGANIGMFANVAYHKGAKEIFCFEPSDVAFDCLTLNKPFNAHTFKCAIGDYDGLTTIALPSEDDTMGASIFSNKGVVNYSPITTLDSLFETGILNKIDFLKIDCEGAEKQVFLGISDENLKNVRKISLEYHSNALSEEYSDSLLKRMTDSGFRFFQLFIGDGSLRIYNFWRE